MEQASQVTWRGGGRVTSVKGIFIQADASVCVQMNHIVVATPFKILL